jgi:hypothetical protein
LTTSREVGEGFARNADALEFVEHTERIELSDGVREQIDSDSKWLYLRY